jgi:hypothetical protein
MERPIITVPQGFLRATNFDWDIDWRGQPPSDRTSGVTQTVVNAFPRWVGSPQIYLRGALIGQWKAIRGSAQGRVGIYRVPMCDPVGFALSEAGTVPADGLTYSDGNLFDNDKGFTFNPVCEAVTRADAGAEKVRVSSPTVAPKQGQIMSHDDWPFEVSWVQEVSAGTYDIGVQMPLRSTIYAGDTVNLQGVGRFEAVEEGMGNPSYGSGRVSTPRLQFREVLTR